MLLRSLLCAALCIQFSACSVFMAASGSDPFDPSVVTVGAQRADIEKELGKPISFYRKGAGDLAVYQVITGDKADYRRAAAYAVLDGLTLGLAEFATFPTEALQGDQNIFEIYYSPSGRVRSFKYYIRPAPAPNPSDIVEETLSSEPRDA
ncbi:MAG: hypothetical protein J5J00_04110 [Deltaproteobacteria bacterium]|nr:hypothetical protein [Deltaproteobacteria bacterium]